MLKAGRAFRYFLFLALLSAVASGCSTVQTPPSKSNADILSGVWDVDFDLGGTTYHSRMTLKQDGTQFFGEGTDAGNIPFMIVNGQINGHQLDFFKKYSNTPAVVYHGTLSLVDEPDYQGPYLSGNYLVESDNKHISGSWRAQMPDKLKSASPIAAQSSPHTASPASIGTIPSLSGNWDTAYEYNFGIVHSTMVLNQKGTKITGSGIDSSSGEKFVIAQGWYKYPNLSLVRSYKKKQGAKSDRNMTFKAVVSIVDDADYQGPYLSGKTQGGGSWEAQLKSDAKSSSKNIR